jgi:hypothetical protein
MAAIDDANETLQQFAEAVFGKERLEQMRADGVAAAKAEAKRLRLEDRDNRLRRATWFVWMSLAWGAGWGVWLGCVVLTVRLLWAL